MVRSGVGGEAITFGEASLWEDAGTGEVLEKIYIPVNKIDSHWGAVEIDLPAKELRVMDSCLGIIKWKTVCKDHLIPWLEEMGRMRNRAQPVLPALPNSTAWSWSYLDVPPQARGGNECGACTVYNIHRRRRNEAFRGPVGLELRELLLLSLQTAGVCT